MKRLFLLLVLLGVPAFVSAQSVFVNDRVQSGSTCPPVFSPGGGTGTLYTCTGTGALYTWTGSAWTAVVSGSAGTIAIGSVTGLGTGVGTFLATPSSANLVTAVTDETGSGSLVFGTAPTLASTVTVGTQGGTTGAINLKGTTSGTATITAAAAAGTNTFTWPTAVCAGCVLQTDGSGVMSFTTLSSAPITVGGINNGGGKKHTSIRVVNGTDSVTATDAVILANTSGGGFTLTLPLASSVLGLEVDVKLQVAGNLLTIGRSGSDTIDGATSLTTNILNTNYTLQAVASGQWIVK